jgi:transposase
METAYMLTDLANGMSKQDVARKYGISVRSVYRRLELKNGKRKLKPCGTVAAYKRHNKHRDPPCDKCSAANARYVRTGVYV